MAMTSHAASSVDLCLYTRGHETFCPRIGVRVKVKAFPVKHEHHLKPNLQEQHRLGGAVANPDPNPNHARTVPCVVATAFRTPRVG